MTLRAPISLQTFLWMVFIDFSADLIASPNKLGFVVSPRAILDMITMPVTALIIMESFILAGTQERTLNVFNLHKMAMPKVRVKVRLRVRGSPGL